jgi:hypothetical protein
VTTRDPQSIVDRLVAFQATVRDAIVRSRASAAMHEVGRTGAADHIYRIDAEVEPLLTSFCDRWAADEGPIVLVAEGLEDEHGREARSRVFPSNARDQDAKIRMIVDPIDGTRGIMYDKRAAWSLAGVAPNRGPSTRLRDIEVAVMTELPTSKMGHADVLSAVRGRGTIARRVDLTTGAARPLPFRPSPATNLEHCFATVVNFFPSTKVLAGELMEHIARRVLPDERGMGSLIFDDQYISTGGQFYELIVGHDRFNADLRPLLYRLQGRPGGFCCHPYDCAAALIAEEAGVILTDAAGQPLDAPFDTTSDVAWVAYANESLRRLIEPAIRDFFDRRGLAR